MKDYYKILEVNETSTEEDIKKSYRKLSKKYHPDVNPDGAEKFKEITEAYDILSNKNKKREYDNLRSNPFQTNGSFDDIFSQMFNRGGFNQRRNGAPDKIVKIEISPIESFLGSKKTIQYSKDNHCETCNGNGGTHQNCNTCNGQGYTIKTFGNGFMVQQFRTVCSSCAGRGYQIVHKCNTCNGKGVNTTINTLNITLPNGIDSGQYLRVDRQGDFRNGEYGDLIIQVTVVSKDGYEKINNDLIYSLFLDLDEIKNKKYKIPHPKGDITVDAPNVFDTSKPLRINGMGYNGGDMYVKLHVRFRQPN